MHCLVSCRQADGAGWRQDTCRIRVTYVGHLVLREQKISYANGMQKQEARRKSGTKGSVSSRNLCELLALHDSVHTDNIAVKISRKVAVEVRPAFRQVRSRVQCLAANVEIAEA